MGRYKMVALDMDGTLLNSKHAVSDENRRWIDKALEAGVTVSFSTGRGIQSIQDYLDDLGLQTPIIAVNGSEVYRKPGDLLVRHLMDLEWIRDMHRLAELNDTWFWAYAVEGVFNKDHWVADPAAFQWLKFGFHTEDDRRREHILQTLRSWGTLEITNSSPYNLELNPTGISKASGIEEICRMLGIGMHHVVAMGDSLNDIAMIRQAGLGVAMGNAQEPVKQAADYITSTNDEDGVARVIREFVLGETN